MPGTGRGTFKSTIRLVGNEITSQDEHGLINDWYHGDGGDLYVWRVAGKKSGAGGGAVRFLLTFFTTGKDRWEIAVLWSPGKIQTGTVDSSEVDSRSHDIASPVLNWERTVNKNSLKIARKFLEAQKAVPPEIRNGLLGLLAQ